MNVTSIAPRLKGLVKIGRSFVAAKRPEILFGTSVVSTVAAVGLSAKAGWDARGDVERLRADRVFEEQEEWFSNYLQFSEAMDNSPQLSRNEIAELCWRRFVPAGVATLTSLTSTTGLHLVHVKEKKQLAAVAMSAIDEVKTQAEQFAKDVHDSVKENVDITPEQEEKIHNSLMEKNADRNGGVAMIQHTDDSLEEFYLVRDAKTGRDIWSNEARIERAMNETNAVITKQGDCELNHFYSMAGFGLLPDGDDWGWSGRTVDLRWDLTIRDDGRPVRRFTFRSEPEQGYNSAHN